MSKKYPGIAAFLPAPAQQQSVNNGNGQGGINGAASNGGAVQQPQGQGMMLAMLSDLAQGMKEVRSAMPVIQSQLASVTAKVEKLETGNKATKKSVSADKVKQALNTLGKGGSNKSSGGKARTSKSKKGAAPKSLGEEMAEVSC